MPWLTSSIKWRGSVSEQLDERCGSFSGFAAALISCEPVDMNAQELLDKLSVRAEEEFASHGGFMREMLWVRRDGQYLDWFATKSEVPANIDDASAIRALAGNLKIDMAGATAYGSAYPATITLTLPPPTALHLPVQTRCRGIALEVHDAGKVLVAHRLVGESGRLGPLSPVDARLANWGGLA